MTYSFGIVVAAIASTIIIADKIKKRGYSVEFPWAEQMVRNIPGIRKREPSFHVY